MLTKPTVFHDSTSYLLIRTSYLLISPCLQLPWMVSHQPDLPIRVSVSRYPAQWVLCQLVLKYPLSASVGDGLSLL